MNGFEMILPFLKPIEHLILDDSISEVMVNGAGPGVYREGGLPAAGQRTFRSGRSPSWSR